MQRLKSFLGLVTAVAITALGAHAQDVATQFNSPVLQDLTSSEAITDEATQPGTPAVQELPSGAAITNVVSQLRTPVDKDLLNRAATKKVKGQKATRSATEPKPLTPVSDFKASENSEDSEDSAATQPRKKAPARKVTSASELAGTYVLNGTSLLTSQYNGLAVSIEAVGTDSIVVNNFWSNNYTAAIKGKVDGSTISFPRQVMGQSTSYGDIVFAKANISNDGQPIDTEAVTATIGEDGNITFNDPWGSYVMADEEDDYWSYFAIVDEATLDKCNATFTGKVHDDGSTETYGVVFTQTSDNAATIKNLGNYGQTVVIELNRDKTARIPYSLIGYYSYYGDYHSYNISFSDTTINTGDAVTQVATDNRTLTWTNWCIATGSTSGTIYLIQSYDSCFISTTTDISYPVLSVSEWDGEGTEASPYLIKVRDDLVLLSDKVAEGNNYKGSYFKVANDIDMDNYLFTPIGKSATNLFSGSFDGGGYTLSNLFIKSSTNYAGLFGATDSVATIKNINIDKANVTSSAAAVAALVGMALGDIENISVSNSTLEATGYALGAVAGISNGLTDITVTDCEITSNYGYSGGIVGEAHGDLVNCYATGVNITSSSTATSYPGTPVGGIVGNLYMATVENCFFFGGIDARSGSSIYQSVGGLVGWVNGSTVKSSFAVADIQTYGAIAGGLAGYLLGDIENCYANGRVYGPETRYTGGLVGTLSYYYLASDTETPIQPSIKNVYSTADVEAYSTNYESVSGAQQMSEVIGLLIDGVTPTISNLYFDKQLVNITKSEYGVTTEELIASAGPSGFDATVWTFSGSTYPALKALETTNESKLSTIAIVIAENASFDVFSREATINKDSESVVSFYKNGELSTTGYYATIADGKITLNTESLFGNDTIYFTNPNVNASYYRIATICPVALDGSGTEDNPFLIKTKADLILLSQYTTVSNQIFPGTYFKVVNDIDLELDESFLGICANGTTDYYFAGTIDGDGHTIHRMKLNCVTWSSKPETGYGTLSTQRSYQGFVGCLGANGVVKNLNFANDCELEFYQRSGTVVGYNRGTVENCRNYADVTGYYGSTGGITGYTYSGKIYNCYNEGAITNGYAWVAGITGLCQGYIEGCMNVGQITVKQLTTNYTTQLKSAGGIAGTSSSGSKFVNCVNAGTISAQLSGAGGLTGNWTKTASSAATYKNDLNNVINYGPVICPDHTTIGAIAAGTAQSGSTDIYGVYWDKQLIDIPADCGADRDDMNGVETSVLISGTALDGFDTDVWQFEAGKYPVLKQFADETKVQQAALVQLTIPSGITTGNLTADAVITRGTSSLAQGTDFTLVGDTLKGVSGSTVVVYDTLTVVSEGFIKIIPIMSEPVMPLEGSGTEADPYRISNAQEWNAFADYVSATANDMTGCYVAVTGEIDFTNEADGITPIGGDGITAFNGYLDGNNHTVSGYAFTSTATYQGALFGTIGADAIVSNLTATGSATGGLGGSTGTTKLGYVAGVVGKLYGKLKNITHSGTVTGISTYTGGVAAYVYTGASLDSVTNTGTVTTTGNYVSGVAAYVYGSATFNYVTNTGTISSTGTYVTGIAAYTYGAGVTFNYCVNKGDLSTTKGYASGDYVAGIAGYARPATFNYCVNDGNLSGSAAAGILAYGSGTAGSTYTFNECVNNGNITGNALLGGIAANYAATVGSNVANYIRCVNNGDITATSTAALTTGGVAGIAATYGAGSTFDHCVNYGNVTSNINCNTSGITSYFRGAPSATYPLTIKGCENYGKISGQGQQVAGIIAYVSNNVTIDSCYNYGDVEQGTYGAAGICYYFAGDNSSLTNCVNYGDVTVAQYYAGGIVGNNINANSVVDGCINLGNVSTSSTDASTGYGIGGIAGAAYTNIANSFNAGKVTGKVRTGGIVGSPSYDASTAQTRITSCVNIGAVSADAGSGGPVIGTEAGSESTYWGDTNTCTDTYYLTDQSWRGTDATVGDYVPVGTGYTVAQLAGLDNGTAWYTADGYSFPVPAIGKDNADVLTNAAAVVLTGEDTYANVTNYQFYAGSPAGTVWTPSSSIVVINGNDVQVTEKSQIEVTLTNATASAQQAPATEAYSGAEGVDWILKLNVEDVSGINDNTLGKVVAQEAYYTVNGLLVEKPEASDGQIYIVVRKYTDGTMNAIKIRN